MNSVPAISQDLISVWRELRQRNRPPHELMAAQVWRPLTDVAIDWTMVILAVALVHSGAVWLLPVCLLVIGNRQRALGNVLHDAAHHNLCRHARINDAIALCLVTPLLLNDLARYRELHYRHHARLGDAAEDPDLIEPLGLPGNTWTVTYLGLLLDRRAWWRTVWGHVGNGMPRSTLLYVVLWWSAAMGLLAWATEPSFAAAFIGMWLAARATTFHAITALREMCDHFGMQRGGIYSFTRDIVTLCPLRWLVHPRNNCYHLTHHLMPSVPYFNLPRAQALLQETPSYRARGRVCKSYVFGNEAVVGSPNLLRPAQ